MLGIALSATGCRTLELINHATVQGFVISNGFNDPPIKNDRTFDVIEVDGHKVTREPIPPLIETHPAAWVVSGIHVFKVAVWLPNHHVGDYAADYEVMFTATVESGKRYFLISKDDQPALVEQRARKQ